MSEPTVPRQEILEDLFKAMSFIWVVTESLDQDREFGRREVLESARQLIGTATEKMEQGHPLVEPEEPAELDRKTLMARIEAQRQAIFELQGVVSLTNDALRAFSGDEESALTIVEAISTHSYALDGARRLCSQINEQLELIGRELE